MRKYLNVPVIIAAICAIYIPVSVFVFSCSTVYTVPVGDDLFTAPAEYASLLSLISDSAAHAVHTYRTWVGTFFSFFLTYLLSPFHASVVPAGAGNLTKLGIVMFLNAFLFFLALLYLIRNILRRVSPKQYRLYAYTSAAVLAGFLNLNAQSYAEVFFWLTPAAVYSMPMITALCSLALYTNADAPGKKRYAAGSAVLAFLTCGGVLMIAGALCYILLALLVFDRVKTGTLNRRRLAVFGSAFAGALINTLAPGNFLRSGTISGSARPLHAIVSTVKYTVLETESLFSDTLMLPVLIVALMLGFLCYRAVDADRLHDYTVLNGMLLPAPVVALLPLQLGNGGVGMAVRGQFVFDLILFLLLFSLCFFCGSGLAVRAKNEKKENILFPAALVLVACLSLNRTTILTLPQTCMLRNLANGSYRDYRQQIQTIMLELENSTEKDVVIDLPEELDQYQNFLLSTDPDHYINHALRLAHGKDTVRASE
ncbi:MAG: hypothetical protein IJQ21_08675 [Lachnospiraceae bacterium]|nr:hypothetical protein [Lachnospiraceae bacterium]